MMPFFVLRAKYIKSDPTTCILATFLQKLDANWR